jgi:GntR family transcriptional regulator, carbon starvation induced regulator
MTNSSTIAGQVFESLLQDLKSNRFKPGERLKFEEMRDRYDVSIASLREALSRLAGLGLVTQIGQKGFRAPEVSLEDFEHVVASRKFLERRALESSIARGDDQWENELVAMFHQLQKATRVRPKTELEHSAWERHHTNFHRALIAACGSPWLLNAWRSAFDQAERYRHIAMKRGHWKIDQKNDHERLLKAALGRNIPLALRILDSHIGHSADMLSDLIHAR